MAAIPADVLVVLDEAYAEFVNDPSAVRGHGLLERYPNLVVLRTFSKAYGLAGLRIGYAIGPEYVMDAARAVAIPLSVTEPAQRAALVSLDHEAELMDRVGRLNLLRDRIWAGLVEQGWDTPEPHGNFVWLRVGPRVQEAAEVLRAARNRRTCARGGIAGQRRRGRICGQTPHSRGRSCRNATN